MWRRRVSLCVSAGAGILLGVVWTGLASAQMKDEPGRALFGISLSGQPASLLDEVEHLFNRRIREDWLDDPNGMSGKSVVGPDGIPTIYVQREHGRAPDVIVHELYHLKLK